MINEELLKRFNEMVQIRYFVKNTDIEIHPPILFKLKNEYDFLFYAFSILSDIQEMIKSKKLDKNKINNEINETKFFISLVMEQLKRKVYI
jgi:hypothetical protein